PIERLVLDSATLNALFGKGPDFQCPSTRSANWNVNAGISFVTQLLGSVAASLDLKKATRVVVAAESMAVDDTDVGLLEQYLATIKESDSNYPVLKALEEKRTVLVVR